MATGIAYTLEQTRIDADEQAAEVVSVLRGGSLPDDPEFYKALERVLGLAFRSAVQGEPVLWSGLPEDRQLGHHRYLARMQRDAIDGLYGAMSASGQRRQTADTASIPDQPSVEYAPESGPLSRVPNRVKQWLGFIVGPKHPV